ncbi:hypothetical protein V8C37DRAFT_387968 [Trichoderma ceciliae]
MFLPFLFSLILPWPASCHARISDHEKASKKTKITWKSMGHRDEQPVGSFLPPLLLSMSVPLVRRDCMVARWSLWYMSLSTNIVPVRHVLQVSIL